MTELNIKNYVIEKLNISEYEKCNNIWNMSSDPYDRATLFPEIECVAEFIKDKYSRNR